MGRRHVVSRGFNCFSAVMACLQLLLRNHSWCSLQICGKAAEGRTSMSLIVHFDSSRRRSYSCLCSYFRKRMEEIIIRRLPTPLDL